MWIAHFTFLFSSTVNDVELEKNVWWMENAENVKFVQQGKTVQKIHVYKC